MSGQVTSPRQPTLPTWSSVLAVVAHPDDESFGLGAVLDAFVQAGATASVSCLTQGEASTLHGVTGDLPSLRAAELTAAATELGVARTFLNGHEDGRLAHDHALVVPEVVATARTVGAEGLVVFDVTGVTGHPDHVAATTAALAAADELDLPVLAWTIPLAVAETLNHEFGATFVGCPDVGVDIRLTVGRDRQLRASRAHASQAVPTSVLWRRLELLGNVEHLRWLRPPGPTSQAREG